MTLYLERKDSPIVRFEIHYTNFIDSLIYIRETRIFVYQSIS